MNPKWPVFIPTKGRFHRPLTIRMFQKLGVPFILFVEAQEFDHYAALVPTDQIVTLPHQNRGLTVTRNYIWDYAAERGCEWFWTFDDNIDRLYRWNNNQRIPCGDGTVLAVVEDFVGRYENIAIAGLQYRFFVQDNYFRPPYKLNTRVYSNMLIRTFATDQEGKSFRNTTFFNDDTDLCLRVLKSNWTTVLFNAFLVGKAATMSVSGGMTDYYEKTNKRREFCEELQRSHPDVVHITQKWGRWQHQVNYSGFTQQLRRRADAVIPDGVNNFGMVLQERRNGHWTTLDETGKSQEVA